MDAAGGRNVFRYGDPNRADVRIPAPDPRSTMLTDFVRDQAFTIAWFGVMAFAWFGWAQEDPEPSWRWKLGVGSAVGMLLAVSFVWAVIQGWQQPTALEGRYPWFGVLVAVEVVLAGAGALVLWRRGQARWVAWWIAVVVAAHFLPMVWLLNDVSLALLAVLQLAGLVALVPLLRRSTRTTSRVACPLMGASLLLFALASAVVFVLRHGSPF